MTKIRFEDLPSTNTPINAENLNKLNNVIVSSEEPTTGEEVWIQASGNLFDKNNYNLWNGWINESNNTFTANSRGYLVYIPCSPNTTYIVSREVLEANFKVGVADKTPINQGTLTNVINNPYGNSITITSGANDRYLHIYVHYASDTNYTLEQILDSLRVETPKKIHTKNDNGVYEEFYNEEEREVYSTGEQKIGTWIDGKPLYRKVFAKTDSFVADNIFALSDLNYDYINFRYTVYCGEYRFFSERFKSDSDFILSALNHGARRFELAVSSGWLSTLQRIIVIAEYTKTTD